MDATELAYAGAAVQARMISAGEVSAREVVQASLDRVARLDPRLNAFRVVLAERALMEADQADGRRGAGETRPLLGVPVAVKDDVDVAGEVTALGTAAHGGPAAADCEAVRRLRSAGAIVVGKTNVPELMMWPFTETLTFGATRNPWSLGHTPGGSSGGSGAAAAAGLCGVALGSDGAGSIRIPAAFCGLFGIKPQRGRVPTAPKVDSWQGLNHLGPLARTVADAALFLDATADGVPDGGYVAAASRLPGRLRVAVCSNLPPGVIARLGAPQRAALDAMANLLGSLGHEVSERSIDYGPALFPSILTRHMRGIRDDLATVPHPERLEPRTRAMGRLAGLLPDGALARARAAEAGISARINTIFDHADVVLAPGPAGPPFRVGAFHGHGALWTINGSEARVPYYGAFNVTGQPAASIPAGFDDDGLPLAVQLVGRPDDEATLLALSTQVEMARPWADQRPPLG